MIAFAARLTSILERSKLTSSSLTVGTATSVVACAALMGLVMDRSPTPVGGRPAVVVQSDLVLRGTLAPEDQPQPSAPTEYQPSQRAIVARL